MADLAHHEWSLISGLDILPDAAAHGLELVGEGDFDKLFRSESTRALLGADIEDSTHPDVEYLRDAKDYAGYVERRIASNGEVAPHALLSIGIAALWSFIQANVTGPPLPFTPEDVLLPKSLGEDKTFVTALSKEVITSLSVDGETAYHLTPKALLLSLSRTILNSPTLTTETSRWWRVRVNFTHQKILSEATATLHNSIYSDIEYLLPVISAQTPAIRARFLIEKALVDTYFGHDVKALKGLEEAAALTGLQYALTGVLGKRTKFQQTDISQLVVLASSTTDAPASEAANPKSLDLNDDTLLESIAFTPKSTTVVEDTTNLPSALAALNPNEQPKLHPLDSAILLLVAETIKNTNPAEGLTREEMMPYAERVLKHSTNWEVYTLGLLVRSKIEGYRSRTTERGLLQLQAVVDQVIADTTNSTDTSESTNGTTTFLPRAKQDEAAPIKERLLYIHQLSVPTRWDLEAELASRWISLGGLRTALEIYERLEMWPEVALCWAATEKEDKARAVIRTQLFDPSTSTELDPPPANAPRLWCILGDIDSNPAHYERAWTVSNSRYARAMRSLGRHHFSAHRHSDAASAYTLSLSVNPLNHASWFALGCCHLETESWEPAIEAFTRAVSIDDSDAEAWSNLASALLHRTTTLPAQPEWPPTHRDAASPAANETNKRNALAALKRAAALSHDSWRIWENLLIIAASVSPPEYSDVVVALQRIVALRGDTAGESCIDVEILTLLVRHVITTSEYEPGQPGLARMVVELMERSVVPLVTREAGLWRLVAKIALWRGRPRDALEAEEKAWRAVGSRAGVTDTEEGWEELVDATVELVDAYASLGEREREGLGGGEVVARDWRFKGRSAVRGVLGRGRNWEGGKGWERLKEVLEGLKK